MKNEWGYTVLNSVPCCKDCNYAKQSLAASHFISHAARIVAHNATYEQFKTRWLITRTGGPTCLSMSSTAEFATKPTSGFSLEPLAPQSTTTPLLRGVLSAVESSSTASRGLRRFPLASTVKAVAYEHPAHATEVCSEDRGLPSSPESEMGEGRED